MRNGLGQRIFQGLLQALPQIRGQAVDRRLQHVCETVPYALLQHQVDLTEQLLQYAFADLALDAVEIVDSGRAERGLHRHRRRHRCFHGVGLRLGRHAGCHMRRFAALGQVDAVDRFIQHFGEDRDSRFDILCAHGLSAS